MKQKDCLDKDGMRPDVARRRRDRKEEIGNKGGRGGRSYGREVILTIGHTLILDLQVLVGPWAGVREDI